MLRALHRPAMDHIAGLGGSMQNALLRLGSLTILVAIALIGMAQVMSVAIAFGNPSQRLGTELVPPFPHKHGMLPGGLGAQFAEGPPYPRGIGRHGYGVGSL